MNKKVTYHGDVLLNAHALSTIADTEWDLFCHYFDQTELPFEEDYKMLVDEINESDDPDSWEHPDLVNAGKLVIRAAKKKGFDIVAGYVYNEFEANIVFAFQEPVLEYSLSENAAKQFEKAGLTVDDIFMDSTSNVPL